MTSSSLLDLRSLTHDELEAVVTGQMKLPRFRADQIFRWLHARNIFSFDEMTDLDLDLRRRLSETAFLSSLTLKQTREASDGASKLLFHTFDDHPVESVIICEGRKRTLCVSTQAGCAMGCEFCATGRLGLKRSLTAAEITFQVAFASAMILSRGYRLNNLVYMGMGEPLANYEATVRSLRILMHPLGLDLSSRRLTVSTVGHVPGLLRLASEPFQVNLAVSLNGTTDEQRFSLMPATRKWPLGRLFSTLSAFPLAPRRRITFEYVLIDGINDTPTDARRLVRLVRRLPSKVNLIRLNPFLGCPYAPSSMNRTLAFQEYLAENLVTAMLRKSRGAEIQAGCGQLAGS